MKTRAAVAWKAGAPLSIEEVDLQGPQAGEVLIEVGARSRTDVPKIVDWYMDGKLNVDDLITHKLPLERINEGFALMKSDTSIRSVVVY